MAATAIAQKRAAATRRASLILSHEASANMLTLRPFWMAVLSLACFVASPAAAQSADASFNFMLDGDNSVCLDGQWAYLHAGLSEPGGEAARLPGASSTWASVSVPEDAEQRYPDQVAEGRIDHKTMSGWYRTRFTVPASLVGSRRFLHFVGVSRSCQVWVNGQLAGRHAGMYDAFDIEITEHLVPGENELVVWYRYPLASREYLFLGAQDVGHSRPGIGIWGSVHLVGTEDPFVRAALIQPDPSAASLRVQVMLDQRQREASHVRLRVMDSATGEAVGAAKTVGIDGGDRVETAVEAKGLALWTLENPRLYHLVAEVQRNGETLGRQAFRFGHRSFACAGRNFELNGSPIYLRSLLMWAGHTNRGRDWREARARATRFIERFKQAGCNVVRTAHSPPHPAFPQVADELGFLVYLEIGNQVKDMAHIPAVAREVRRLARQYYNNPSVVMYSLGNEVWGTEFVEPQDALAVALKAVDPYRPVCTVSGGHSWPAEPNEPYRHTDFFDIHSYSGHMDRPWNEHARTIRRVTLPRLAELYGKIDRPIFFGETVGLSWPVAPHDMRSDAPITPERYVALAQDGLTPMWASQVGVWKYYWPVARVGGAGAANYKINGRIASLVSQQMRQLAGTIQGHCLWGDIYNEATYTSAFSDVAATAWDTPRNAFAGETLTVPACLSNLSPQALRDVKVTAQLRDPGTGEVLAEARRAVTHLGAVATAQAQIELSVPSALATGTYELVLSVSPRDVHVRYPMYVLNTGSQAANPGPEKKQVWLVHDAGGRYAAICRRLGYIVRDTRGSAPAADAGLAILSLGGAPLPGDKIDLGALREWVHQGGRLIVDRVAEGDAVPAVEGFRAVRGREMPSVEVVAPQHPLFDGLGEDNFFFWDAHPRGHLIGGAIYPLTTNVLAGKGFDQNVTMAVSEFKISQGLVLVNQLWSAEAAEDVASARAYTANLLSYMSSDAAGRDAYAPSGGIKVAAYDVQPEDALFIDLSNAANRAFTDHTPDDQAGGWTDQGPDSDLDMIESGTVTLGGVPFRILDDEGGDRATCIALQSSVRPYFPEQSARIVVGRKLSDLYFLHTAAWCRRQYVGGRPLAYYVITYEDGLSVEVPVIAFRDIGDWWWPSDLANAAVAWRQPHPTIPGATIGLYVMRWENPHPEKMIMSIQARSAKTSSVPLLVAITGTVH